MTRIARHCELLYVYSGSSAVEYTVDAGAYIASYLVLHE